MQRNLFPQFAHTIQRVGANGVQSGELTIDHVGTYRLQYIPFESVNRNARLVIVGITPGPTQLKLAYEAVKRSLDAGMAEATVLVEAMRAGAFGGKSMRPNLLRMLRHFRFERLLGIGDVEALWNANANLLHSTSVVPHAAFKKEKMFNGRFSEIIGSSLLRECFEDCFIASVKEINPQAFYVGLGSTPGEALEWGVERGILRREQVLGAFAHPSTSGGSRTAYYLREKSRDDLDPRDPTRHQCNWLDQSYEQMRRSTLLLGAGPADDTAVVAPAKPAFSPKTPIMPRKDVRRAEDEEVSGLNSVYQEFERAGFKLNKRIKYVGEFVAPVSGQIIYVDNQKTRLNRVALMVHPSLKPEEIERLDGVESVGAEIRFNSNLTRFPKRINRGATPHGYGWPVTINSHTDLRHFLRAFPSISF